MRKRRLEELKGTGREAQPQSLGDSGGVAKATSVGARRQGARGKRRVAHGRGSLELRGVVRAAGIYLRIMGI